MNAKQWAGVIGTLAFICFSAPLVVVLGVAGAGGGSASAASLVGSTRLDFAEAFATDIGADNEPAVMFVVAWEEAEGASQSANNPLDSTLPETGSTPLPANSAGVQMYPSLGVGLQADVGTVLSPVYAPLVADAAARGLRLVAAWPGAYREAPRQV